jgi:hypothetical protein
MSSTTTSQRNGSYHVRVWCAIAISGGEMVVMSASGTRSSFSSRVPRRRAEAHACALRTLDERDVPHRVRPVTIGGSADRSLYVWRHDDGDVEDEDI